VTDVPDHPVIQNCERTGYPDGYEPEYPHCPQCGGTCMRIYKESSTGEILGCDMCIDEADAFDVDECWPNRKE